MTGDNEPAEKPEEKPAEAAAGENAGSAFGKMAGDASKDAPEEKPEEQSAEAAAGESAGSAFGKMAGDASKDESAEKPEEKPANENALDKMSDEDWTRAVLPDDENGGRPADSAFMQDMAKACREAGVSPGQMQKVYARFNEVIEARGAALRAAEEEAAAKARDEAVAAFDDDGWKSILAAGRKYAPAGSDLEKLLAGREGSNKGLLKVLKDLGDTLRSEDSSATATAGSSQSLDERLFIGTVPTELRR